jgi:hypothetical protein
MDVPSPLENSDASASTTTTSPSTLPEEPKDSPICNMSQMPAVESKRTIHALKEKIRRLQKKVEDLKEKQKQNSNSTLLDDVPLATGKSENMCFNRIIKNVFQHTIKVDCDFWMWGHPKIGKMLAIMFSVNSDICHKLLIKQSKQWLHKNMFKPLSILEEMDLAGGTLVYEGYAILCKVKNKAEDEGSKQQRFCRAVDKINSALIKS